MLMWCQRSQLFWQEFRRLCRQKVDSVYAWQKVMAYPSVFIYNSCSDPTMQLVARDMMYVTSLRSPCSACTRKLFGTWQLNCSWVVLVFKVIAIGLMNHSGSCIISCGYTSNTSWVEVWAAIHHVIRCCGVHMFRSATDEDQFPSSYCMCLYGCKLSSMRMLGQWRS